jgi:sulfite reductase (NADPH) flavoprotein alpha-component
MAGLRAHLKARAAAGGGRVWLLFGERNAVTDLYYREEIEAWRSEGVIARLDLVFSRDQAERVYVQQRLAAEPDVLREWITAGAAIYVCGSLEGMAPGVETALSDILGSERLEELSAAGRYRRDVY